MQRRRRDPSATTSERVVVRARIGAREAPRCSGYAVGRTDALCGSRKYIENERHNAATKKGAASQERPPDSHTQETRGACMRVRVSRDSAANGSAAGATGAAPPHASMRLCAASRPTRASPPRRGEAPPQASAVAIAAPCGVYASPPPRQGGGDAAGRRSRTAPPLKRERATTRECKARRGREQ